MKTLVIILICISAIFAVIGAIGIWKEYRTRKGLIWKRIGFTALAFILGAIIWPVLCCKWAWDWLKEHHILKITLEGLVIMAIGAAMIYFGCLFS